MIDGIVAIQSKWLLGVLVLRNKITDLYDPLMNIIVHSKCIDTLLVCNTPNSSNCRSNYQDNKNVAYNEC